MDIKKALKEYLLTEKLLFGIDEYPVPNIDGGLSLESPLDKLKKEVLKCKKCPLGGTRLNPVFGEGNPKAKLMFVGEGPGYEEDHQGRPFVGRAGELLTKIIESINLKREDVYITNIVKCHPMIDPSNPEKRGNDRAPNNEEITKCINYLKQQIEIIKPKIICALGSVAAKTLLRSDKGIKELRGKKYKYNDETIIIPTYHPAALLRNPSLKKETWQDIKLIRELLKKL